MYSLTCSKIWISIQSIILSICASGCSSGLPENSGLKYDHFIAMGTGGTSYGCTGGITGCSSCCCCCCRLSCPGDYVVPLPDALLSFLLCLLILCLSHLCICLLIFIICSYIPLLTVYSTSLIWFTLLLLLFYLT